MLSNLDIAPDELIIDYFAGGGGTSEGLREGLGREPDVAVNHDPVAVAMHMANHPRTIHFTENVRDIRPQSIVHDPATGEWKKVALFWLSPDCTDFSKAKGGKPVRKHIRSLAWCAKRWAALPRPSKPRVIILENVEEFQQAGPVVRDAAGNWRPCPKRRGRMFKNLLKHMRAHGYDQIEYRQLRACDYGKAATRRRRLFVIFRCDGKPIRWPEITHGDPASPAVQAGKLKPWLTFADKADWSLPTYSIFLTREEARRHRVKRPLARKTMARIYHGTMRHVITNAEPFLITITHGAKTSTGTDGRCYGPRAPIPTITGANRGEFALIAPTLVEVGYGERVGQFPRAHSARKPLGTIVGTQKHALVTAFLAQHNAGPRNGRISGHPVTRPASTFSTTGSQQQLTVAFLDHAYGSNVKAGAGEPGRPLKSLTAGGNHHFVVNADLQATAHGAAGSFPGRAAEVAAFLMEYYSEGGQWQRPDQPLNTIPAKDRFALVTVQGQDFVITDIASRMLAARELYDVTGFSPTYIIDLPVPCPKTGRMKPITKEQQNRLVGNAVPPIFAEVLSRAQFALPETEPLAEAAE